MLTWSSISALRARKASSVALLVLLGTLASANAQSYTYTVLYNFAGQPDGDSPSSIVKDKAGNIYGTTYLGGAYGLGTVFKIDPQGSETVLYSFRGSPDGYGPLGLLLGGNGELYGVTAAGGVSGFGTVFKMDGIGKEVVLYSFAGGTDGSGPIGLVEDAAGNFYGTTCCGGVGSYGTVFSLTRGGTHKVLYGFAGAPDGSTPQSGLIRDAAGNLYGTTYYAGPYLDCGLGYGCGNVFKLSEQGDESVLYSFDKNGGDGFNPSGNLIQDAAGNFYGTTYNGGALYGIVYKLNRTGQETVLYNFLGDFDGENPRAGLVLDTAGNLYGTTTMGGNKGNCFGGFFYSGCGTVFEITPGGQEIQLHAFKGEDGEYPGALIRDSSGRLYGTAAGGTCAAPFGCGVVFELTPHN
jgi:uncharacterized repeat protein (TIGR03803 family)